MNNKLKGKLTLFLLTLMVCSMFAQKNGKIIGSLSDYQTQESIPFATISLVKDGHLTSKGASSDFDGMFEIVNLNSISAKW